MLRNFRSYMSCLCSTTNYRL